MNNYVTSVTDRLAFGAEVVALEARARARMNESVKAKSNVPFKEIIGAEVNALATVSDQGKAEFNRIIGKLPLAYSNVPAIFRSLEAKTPGAGGLFSIFVSDLCKGCGECVQVCGDHDALRMVREGRADLALGSRYTPGGAVADWGLTRRLVSRGGCLYAQAVLTSPVRDLTGGFKCFRAEVLEAIERSSLIVTDVEILRLHYAMTLRAWRERFETRRQDAATLYDERFCRMWEFYLAYAETGFRSGILDVARLTFTRE